MNFHRSIRPSTASGLLTTTLLYATFAVGTALGPSTTAQIGVLALPAGTGDDPRSVQFIGNGHVVVSERVDGWQHFVDVSVPNAPSLTSSLNPPFWDQWFEAEYTPAYGGRLFTAHRGGGLNMIDVSNPNLPVVVSSLNSGYHFRGLRYQRGGSGPYTGRLLYNSTNQGLEVYDIVGSGSSMVAGWNGFGPNQDGNGLELINDNVYQLGKQPFSPYQRELRTYTAPPNLAPVQCDQQSFPSVGDGHALLRRSLLPCPRIMSCEWRDGLHLIDASNPCSPVRTQLFPSQLGPLDITYWGAASIPSSPWFVAYGSFLINNDPNTRQYFWWFWHVPAFGAATPGLIVTLPFDTRDIQFEPQSGRVYVVGRNTNTNQGQLQIF